MLQENEQLTPNENTNSVENPIVESSENENSTETPPEIQKNDTIEQLKAETKAENQIIKTSKAKTRASITVNFTDGTPESEFVHLEKIINARIEAGISKDRSHFLRQCIDFAINHEKQLKKQLFAVPEIEHRLLKDGFYTTENTGYEVCK